MALALTLLFAMAPPVCADDAGYTVTVICGNQECVLSSIEQTPITESTTIGDIKSEFIKYVNNEVVYSNENLQLWYGIPLTDETASLQDYKIPNGAKLKLVSLGAEIAVNANMKLAGTKQNVYKVDITWGSMEFTYAPKKVWDPISHTLTSEHSDKSWSCEEGANEITVTNHSSAAVNIDFQYQAIANSTVNGEITVDGNNTNLSSATVGLEAANTIAVSSVTAKIKLDGVLDSGATEKQILGHVTVPVSPI